MDDQGVSANDNTLDNEVVEQQVSEPVDRREALRAAFDAAEKTEHPDENKTDEHPQSARETSTEAEHSTEQNSETQTQAEKPIKAPASFSPSMRDEFTKLSPEMQAQINKREQDWDNHMRSTSDERNYVKSILDVFAPYQADLAASNLQPREVMKDLLAQVYTLRTGDANRKAQVVSNIIKGYGVDIGTLGKLLDGNGYTQQNAQANDPYMQQINALRQELDQRKSLEQQQYQQAQAARDAQLQEEVRRFASDPKNEFFNDVAPIMQSLLANGQAQTYQDAYDKAVWAHPDVRAMLQKREQEAAQKKMQDAQRAKASASLKGGSPRGAVGQQKPAMSRREAIEASLNAHVDKKI